MHAESVSGIAVDAAAAGSASAASAVSNAALGDSRPPHMVERRYKVEALRFKCLDETGVRQSVFCSVDFRRGHVYPARSSTGGALGFTRIRRCAVYPYGSLSDVRPSRERSYTAGWAFSEYVFQRPCLAFETAGLALAAPRTEAMIQELRRSDNKVIVNAGNGTRSARSSQNGNAYLLLSARGKP